MAVSPVRGLGTFTYALDARFVDQTQYVFENPEATVSLCVAVEPIPAVVDAPLGAVADDAASRRINAAADELSRVYDDLRLGAPTRIVTGAGTAVVLRAHVLGGVELSLAAVELDGSILFVSATVETGPPFDFALTVESIRALSSPRVGPPPGQRWAGAGPVALLVPVPFSDPGAARFVAGSACIAVHAPGSDVDLDPRPQATIPFAAHEAVTLDQTEPPETLNAPGWSAVTLVAAHSVRDTRTTTLAPTDAVMVRTTTVAAVTPQPAAAPLLRLLGVGRLEDWPLLIDSWQQLLASLRVGSP